MFARSTWAAPEIESTPYARPGGGGGVHCPSHTCTCISHSMEFSAIYIARAQLSHHSTTAVYFTFNMCPSFKGETQQTYKGRQYNANDT